METLQFGNPQLDRDALQKVAAFLSDQFTALYDVRPADPRAELAGDILTFVFQGGLSRSDQLLLENGRGRELTEFREHFLRAIGTDLAEVVEQLTEQSVSFFQFGFDPGSRTTSCLFALRARPDEGRERREAIRNWSEQVRRNSRQIRIRHHDARVEHRELIRQMRDIRLGLPPKNGDGAEGAGGGARASDDA